MKEERASKCTCGAPLPEHLTKFRLKMSHVCTCTQKWLLEDGAWVNTGTTENPFTLFTPPQNDRLAPCVNCGERESTHVWRCSVCAKVMRSEACGCPKSHGVHLPIEACCGVGGRLRCI